MSVVSFINGWFNGPVGDTVSIYVETTGQEANIAWGTAASPDTLNSPIFKVVRTTGTLRSTVSGDGGEQMASIIGLTAGVAACQVQTVGTYGGATNRGTANGGSGNPDACGIYGVGRILGSGIGTGIGAFLAGRREVNTGRTCALEVSSQNYTATPGTYSTTGFSDTNGIWVECTGTSDSGVGIAFGNPFGFQYDVGIGFNAQVNGGKTGGVKTASIRDDGNSTTVMDINGSHTDILDTQGATISGKLFKINTPGTYTISNVATTRTYDVSTVTLAQVANTLGTLVADLRTLGLVT